MARVKYLYGPVNTIRTEGKNSIHTRTNGLVFAFRNDALQHSQIATGVGLLPQFGGFAITDDKTVSQFTGESVSTRTVTPHEFFSKTNLDLKLTTPWLIERELYGTLWPLILLLPENVTPNTDPSDPKFTKLTWEQAVSLTEGYLV